MEHTHTFSCFPVNVRYLVIKPLLFSLGLLLLVFFELFFPRIGYLIPHHLSISLLAVICLLLLSQPLVHLNFECLLLSNQGLCLVQRAVLLYDDVDDWASRWNAAGYIYYVAEEAGWAKLKLGSEVEGEREKRSSAWACTSGKGFWKE